MDKIQKVLIKAGRKDLAHEYYLKVANSLFAPLPPGHRPSNSIWYQDKNDLQAYVSKVNDKFNYIIYNVFKGHNGKTDGKKIEEGEEETLLLAKKKVFEYFDKH